VTATAAVTSIASPRPTSSDTKSSSTRRPPTTPSLPIIGPGDDGKRPCRSTTPPDGSTEPRTDAARSARPRYSPPQNAPTPHATGSTGWPPLARRSTSSGIQPERTPLHPTSSTSTATPPASHQGLLEPDARKRACPVHREGDPASQGAGPTRRSSGAATIAVYDPSGPTHGARRPAARLVLCRLRPSGDVTSTGRVGLGRGALVDACTFPPGVAARPRQAARWLRR
jgi:hypothetical protein